MQFLNVLDPSAWAGADGKAGRGSGTAPRVA